MLLSIVTPSLNSIRFLQQTLDSVVHQSYSNVEHIVVDGGSNDGTVALLEAYQNKYPDRLRYISEPDRNNCDAMNKGWKLARGNILGCFGSDDIMPEGTAEYVVGHFKSCPDDNVIYGECNIIDENGDYLGRFATGDFTVERSINDLAGVSFPACFYRRKVVEETGPALVDNLACDHEFLIRAGKQFEFKRLERILAHYRLHAESITGTSWDGAYLKAMYEINRLHSGRLFSAVGLNYFRQKVSQIPLLGRLATMFFNRNRYAGNLPGNTAVIFGAALTGYACLNELRNKGKKVLLFIDNCPPPCGKFSGLPVYKPEYLAENPELEFDAIFLATGGSDAEMRKQLKGLGIKSPLLWYKTTF